MAAAVKSPFDAAYARGITDELPPPTRRGRALPPAPFALHGAVITPEGAWCSGYVTVADGRSTGSAAASPPRAGARDGRGHPARAARPARPPGVQRLRRLGAAEALRQPLRVAPVQAVPGARPRPAEHAAGAGAAQDPDPLCRGARARRRRDRHPGRVGVRAPRRPSRSCATSTSGSSGRTARARWSTCPGSLRAASFDGGHARIAAGTSTPSTCTCPRGGAATS